MCIKFEFWIYWVIWNMQWSTCLPSCHSCCVADTRGNWKLSLQDQQVSSSFDVGTVPPAVNDRMWLLPSVKLQYNMSVHCSKAVFLKWCVLYHLGNQGLMDILDMPNTNKYSFEGWDNGFTFTAFCHKFLKENSHLTSLLWSPVCVWKLLFDIKNRKM